MLWTSPASGNAVGGKFSLTRLCVCQKMEGSTALLRTFLHHRISLDLVPVQS